MAIIPPRPKESFLTPEGNSLYPSLSRGDMKTQKARGIAALTYISGGSMYPGVYYIGTSHVYHLPGGTLPHRFPDGYRFFARPCPLRPRHGFVESRRVRTPEEAVDIYLDEVLPEDPDGELIVMPVLTGRFSAVATNAGVSWGLGHDGVTGGAGGFTIPASTPKNAWNSTWKKRMIVRFEPSIISDTTYVELVENNFRMTAVQLRDGPEPPTTLDYIPRAEEIKVVLHQEGDLLEWEAFLKRLIRANGGPAGLCFNNHLRSLSSHYAVHAIELGIPVICTRNPMVGEKLEPPEAVVPPLDRGDLQRLRRKVLDWLERDFIPSSLGYAAQKAILVTAIATAHTQSQWGASDPLLDLRAMAMVTFLRLTAAATLGEVRHWVSSGPGRWGKRRKSVLVDPDGEKLKERGQIYNHFYKSHPLDDILDSLKTVQKDFNTRGWGRGGGRRASDGGCGYGGPKWARVAGVGIALGNALKGFLRHPTPNAWRRCAMEANNLVHTAHNNGYFFNKWLGGESFDTLARTPGVGFCNAWAAIVALGLGVRLPSLDEDESYRVASLPDEMPDLPIPSPEWSSEGDPS